MVNYVLSQYKECLAANVDMKEGGMYLVKYKLTTLFRQLVSFNPNRSNRDLLPHFSKMKSSQATTESAIRDYRNGLFKSLNPAAKALLHLEPQ